MIEKVTFIEPELEVIVFPEQDILTTSIELPDEEWPEE